ncbi:hypothetical protein [Nocardioides sp. AE5]|uniref:hypothetical protein n=1 Tax=Nocardioides sp. AE5 TaxID=2962573 RepID=UPI0028828254|nr:hypothetical protein [Nocardioides sp. AE5]MDT0202758.1 hypothetical protein [Nocardioides sp. AE5]
MTTSKPNVVRRSARLAASSAVLALAASATFLAAPASANVPEDWSNPDPVDTAHALIVYVGAPLGLILLITLLVMAPSLARGDRGNDKGGADSEWFGGPRKSNDELAAPDTEASQAGGASGKW